MRTLTFILCSFRRTGGYFLKAAEAMVKKDWDTAIELLRRAVQMDSTNLLYCQALRSAEERRKRG